MQVLNTDCRLTQQWQKSCFATKNTQAPSYCEPTLWSVWGVSVSWQPAVLTTDCHKFAAIKPLLSCVLCSSATSAPVERVFCQSGLLMRPHRARMSNCLLETLVFLKCNGSLFVRYCCCWQWTVDSELKLKMGLMQFYQLMLSTDWLWLGFYRMVNSVLTSA